MSIANNRLTVAVATSSRPANSPLSALGGVGVIGRRKPQKAALGIVFGVPVTLNLYRALQRAQGLATDDTQANVPSLTRSQIRGLYSGKLLDWSQITGPNGAALWTFAGTATPTNDDDGNNNNTVDAADPEDTSDAGCSENCFTFHYCVCESQRVCHAHTLAFAAHAA